MRCGLKGVPLLAISPIQDRARNSTAIIVHVLIYSFNLKGVNKNKIVVAEFLKKLYRE